MAEVADVTKSLERAEQPPQEAALRRLIEQERAALDVSLDRLGERFRETVDWRAHAVRHRGALVAAASGAALLGLWRWRRRRTPAERAADAVVASAREVSGRACAMLGTLGSAVSVRRRVPRMVLGPLAAMAARAAMKWWDGEMAGTAQRPSADERVHEEERWRLEKRMS
jgi:hypothetical protein